MENIESTELYTHTPTIYPVFKKWARETNFEGEIISHNEFVKQLQKMPYYKGVKNVRMGGDDDDREVKKCRILDVKILKDKEIIE